MVSKIRVRIVPDENSRFGWFVEQDRQDNDWWAVQYCFTHWGAVRAAKRLLHASNYFELITDD